MSYSKTIFLNLFLFVAVMAAAAEVYHPATEHRVSPEILRALQQVAGGVKPHDKYPVPAMGEEAPSRKVDPLQFQEMIERAREKTVTVPKSIPLPKSAFAAADRTRLAVAEMPAMVAAQTASPNYFWHSILMTLLAMGGAAFIARLLVPELGEYLRDALKPSRLLPSSKADSSLVILAEEKAAAQFHANFCPLPPASGSLPAQGLAPAPAPDLAPAVEPPRTRKPAKVPRTTLERVQELQRLLSEANLRPDERQQRLALRDLSATLKQLKAQAEEPALRPLWQILGAAELLLERLVEKEGSLNSSVLRTLGRALEILGELCQPDLNPNLLVDPPLRILVVDDEAFNRFALCQSLERTLCKPDVADSGAKALELARERPYDLIFLDIRMAGMDGFELCAKIHEAPRNAATPVVFVTALSCMNSRSLAVLSGGRDFMVKPFQTFEVTLKALSLVAHERFCGRGSGAGETAGKPAFQLALH